MSFKNLKDAFHAFNDLRILIIGDAMIDSYLWGDVERISPEAPVPVVSRTEKESRLGGAANVAINIKALGAQPILASVIGNDDRGHLFKQLLTKRQMTKQGIFESNSRVTTIKTRIISNHQHLLRVDEEENEPLDKETETAFLNHLLYTLDHEKVDAIIFEDYDKGAITPVIIEGIVNEANKKGIPTLVDPKKRNYNHYKNVTLFKPNFKELVQGQNLTINKKDNEKIFLATQLMHKQHNIEWMMVTLSEQGVFISNKDTYKQTPARIRDISDVSGAGDTVISIAGACLAVGLSPWTTAELANIGGGQVCERAGVVPVDKEKLLEEANEAVKIEPPIQ
jgi:rfaE bifunctional protein kinase chain/domain